MEELRSTDALDQEIRADARKKAERIVARAEETCTALLGGVGKKVLEAKDGALAKSSQKLDSYARNVNASLPLEKERYLVSYIYGSVLSGVNGYFESLGSDGRLEIVKKMAERSLPVLESRDVSAACLGIAPSVAQVFLKKIFGEKLVSCETCPPMLMLDEELEGFDFHEGVVLSSADGKITCRLTLDEKVKEILDDHTYDLAEALFGGRIPE